METGEKREFQLLKDATVELLISLQEYKEDNKSLKKGRDRTWKWFEEEHALRKELYLEVEKLKKKIEDGAKK